MVGNVAQESRGRNKLEISLQHVHPFCRWQHCQLQARWPMRFQLMQEREIQPKIFTYTLLVAWLQVLDESEQLPNRKICPFWMQEQIFWQAGLLEKAWGDNESNLPWLVGQFFHRPGPMQIVASGKRQSCWAILWKGQERMVCGRVGEFLWLGKATGSKMGQCLF